MARLEGGHQPVTGPEYKQALKRLGYSGASYARLVGTCGDTIRGLFKKDRVPELHVLALEGVQLRRATGALDAPPKQPLRGAAAKHVPRASPSSAVTPKTRVTDASPGASLWERLK